MSEATITVDDCVGLLLSGEMTIAQLEASVKAGDIDELTALKAQVEFGKRQAAEQLADIGFRFVVDRKKSGTYKGEEFWKLCFTWPNQNRFKAPSFEPERASQLADAIETDADRIVSEIRAAVKAHSEYKPSPAAVKAREKRLAKADAKSDD